MNTLSTKTIVALIIALSLAVSFSISTASADFGSGALSAVVSPLERLIQAIQTLLTGESSVAQTVVPGRSNIPTDHRGYYARGCGLDMDDDGIVGEAEDCNVCDGGPSQDVDQDGTVEDEIYVDCKDGNDTTGTGSDTNAYLTIAKAMAVATSHADDSKEDIICVRATCSPSNRSAVSNQDITESGAGGADTWYKTVAASGKDEWEFKYPKNPLMIMGWDTDNDGCYPPFDNGSATAQAAGCGTAQSKPFVMDACPSGGCNSNTPAVKLAFSLRSEKNYIELAHFSVQNYGSWVQNDLSLMGFLHHDDNDAKREGEYVHDIEIRNINTNKEPIINRTEESGMAVFRIFHANHGSMAIENVLLDKTANWPLRGGVRNMDHLRLKNWTIQNPQVSTDPDGNWAGWHTLRTWGGTRLEFVSNLWDGTNTNANPSDSHNFAGASLNYTRNVIRNNEFKNWGRFLESYCRTGSADANDDCDVTIDSNKFILNKPVPGTTSFLNIHASATNGVERGDTCIENGSADYCESNPNQSCTAPNQWECVDGAYEGIWSSKYAPCATNHNVRNVTITNNLFDARGADTLRHILEYNVGSNCTGSNFGPLKFNNNTIRGNFPENNSYGLFRIGTPWTDPWDWKYVPQNYEFINNIFDGFNNDVIYSVRLGGKDYPPLSGSRVPTGWVAKNNVYNGTTPKFRWNSDSTVIAGLSAWADASGETNMISSCVPAYTLDGYHVTSSSCTNNVGDNTACPARDIDGTTRAKSSTNRCDVGADEYGGSVVEPPTYACSNGRDDDGDGKIDYGTGTSNDPGCDNLTDNDEYNAPVSTPVMCSPSTQSVNTGASASFTAANGNGTYTWTATGGSPASGTGATFSTTYASTGTKTVTVTSNSTSASCAVTVTTPPSTGAICSNGRDDDSDGKIDTQDVGCINDTDTSESNPTPVTTKFTVGANITVSGTGGVNVREYPGGPTVGAGQAYQATGRVVAGPKYATLNGNPVWWWQIDYTSGTDGWSGENLLSLVSTPTYACSNSRDDDGDGKIDYPADPGCASATDNDEYNAPPGSAVSVTGLALVNADLNDPTNTGAADILQLTNNSTINLNSYPTVTNISVRALTSGTIRRVVFTVNGVVGESEEIAPYAVASDDGNGNFHNWNYTLDTQYTIIATPYDANNIAGTPYALGFTLTKVSQIACEDTRDNDSDGKVDLADPGCVNADDINESNPAVSTKFAIGTNIVVSGIEGTNVRAYAGGPVVDGVGQPSGATGRVVGGPKYAIFNGTGIWWWQIDYTNAPDGWSGEPLLSEVVTPTYACSNGRDDDSDGKIDTQDVGCINDTDTSESNPTPVTTKFTVGANITVSGTGGVNVREYPGGPTAGTGQAYQATGRVVAGPKYATLNGNPVWWWQIDYTSGTDGWSGENLLSLVSTPTYACSNSRDDDGDGKIDYPADPGCASATDNDEYNAPPGSAVTCTPSTQSAYTGSSATFSAGGGNGTYSWNATGGTPSTGSGANFSTTYSSTGTKTVTVSSDGTSASCAVSVSTAPVQPVSTTQGYQSRACGLDLDFDGVRGEAEDCNEICRAPVDSSGNVTVSVETYREEIYVDTVNGVDGTSCGLNGKKPCKTIARAWNDIAANGSSAKADVVCFAGTERNLSDYAPKSNGLATVNGVAATYTVPKRGNEVRDFKYAKYPTMLVGWDKDRDGKYPPNDNDDVAVIDGAGKPVAFDLMVNKNSYIELAHFKAINFGQNYDTSNSTGVIKGFAIMNENGTDATRYSCSYRSIHDVELEHINSRIDTHDSRRVFSFMGSCPIQYTSIENIQCKYCGGWNMRGGWGQDIEGITKGPLRIKNMTLRVLASTGGSNTRGGSVGIKFWGSKNVEILDNILDAGSIASPGFSETWAPQPDNTLTAIFASGGSENWDVINNKILNFEAGFNIASYHIQETYKGHGDKVNISRNQIINNHVGTGDQFVCIRQTLAVGDTQNDYGDPNVLDILEAPPHNQGTNNGYMGDVTFHSNVCSSPTMHSCIFDGIGNINDDIPNDPGTNRYLNNVCRAPGGARYGFVMLGYTWGAGTPEHYQTRYVVKNNIFSSDVGSNAIRVSPELAPKLNVFDVNNNVYAIGANNTAARFIWGNNASTDLAGWRNTTERPDANAKQCEPSFQSQSNFNFHLQSTDTCAMNSGVAYVNFTPMFDMDGQSFGADGRWDIGADEYR